jgi:SNF2 family DNA or RNA helicase
VKNCYGGIFYRGKYIFPNHWRIYKEIALKLDLPLYPPELEKQIEIEQERIRIIEDLFQNKELIEYSSKIKPFHHQKIITSAIIKLKKLIVLGDRGIGKTKAVIDAIAFLKNDSKTIDKALVIVPKTLLKQWQWEVKKNSDLKVSYYPDYKGDIILVNYEGINDIPPVQMLVLDESTKIKNYLAKRTRKILKLRKHVDYIVLLTGMLITQSVCDVFPQALMVTDALGYNYDHFRERYTLKKELRKIRSFIVYKYVDKSFAKKEIMNILKPYIISIERDKCFDMKFEKKYVEIPIKMNELQKKYYNEVIEQIKQKKQFTKDDITMWTTTLTCICSGFRYKKDGKVEYFRSPKEQELIKILKSKPDEQFIIWHNYVFEGTIISSMIKNSIRITSEDSPEKRDEKIQRALAEKKHLIIPLGIGKFGLNLQKISNVIYYSNSFSVEARIQSEDRVFRHGTSTDVYYYDLVCEDTIEEVILKFLKQRQNVIKKLYGYYTKLMKGGEQK